MNTASPQSPATRNKFLNCPPVDAMPRDQEQSHLIHEPGSRVTSTDPMTGYEIKDIAYHPCLVDGNLTMYFESVDSRKAYQDMPLNHPSLRLPYPATADDDRGG